MIVLGDGNGDSGGGDDCNGSDGGGDLLIL